MAEVDGQSEQRRIGYEGDHAVKRRRCDFVDSAGTGAGRYRGRAVEVVDFTREAAVSETFFKNRHGAAGVNAESAYGSLLKGN